jgi:hypothetical protein
VCAMGVVVHEVLPNDGLEVPPADDDEPVQALTAQCADEALGVGIGSRSANRVADNPQALGPRDLVQGTGELGVSVSEHEPATG